MIRAALRWLGRFLIDLSYPSAPPTITNRAQLLREPTPADDCDVFEPGTPAGDCLTDGHYLCVECRHMSAAVVLLRECWPSTDQAVSSVPTITTGGDDVGAKIDIREPS